MTDKIKRTRYAFKREKITDSIRKYIKLEPHTIFILLAAVFGLIFVFVTPPMQSPDEVEHLYRSYQVSQFNIKADAVGKGFGGTLPVSLIDAAVTFKNNVAGQPNKDFDRRLLDEVGRAPLSPAYQKQIRFDNTAIYSPVPYLPQAFGIGVARTLHLSPLYVIYFGRLANLVFWMLLIFIAIRITLVGKWAFTAIALNPVSLFLASTLSSDAMAIGLSALLVAVVLRLRMASGPLNYKWLSLLGVLSILICLTKNIYIPMVLLLLLIPDGVLKLYKKLIIIIGALASGLAWNVAVLPIAQNIPAYFGMPGAIQTGAQIHGIVEHPAGFLEVLSNNIFGQPSSIAVPSYSGVFGWLDAPNPYWVNLLYFVVLLFAFLYREESREVLRAITWKVRTLFLGTFVVSSLALFGTLYVGYSKVGSGIIDGVQGRYFIPLTFLLVPVLASALISVKVSKRIFTSIIGLGLVVCLTFTLITLSLRYY